MTTLNLQVGASTDDAYEIASSGLMDLVYSLVTFGSPSVGLHNGIRFTGVSGLSGVTITSATLTFRAFTTDNEDFIGDWYGEDAEAPSTFTSATNDITNRTKTAATCEGDGVDFGDWTSGQDETFTDDGVNTIADIIQELVDSYDPSAIVLIHIWTSGVGERIGKSWDSDSSFAPKLDIDYAGIGSAGRVASARGIMRGVRRGVM